MGQIVPVVVTAGTAIAGLMKGQRRSRANIRYDAEILKELPPDSEAYKRLAEHIEDRVNVMAKVEREGSRKPFSAIWCFIFALGFSYAGVVLYALDHWWAVLTAMVVFVFVLFFLYLAFDYLVLAERDEKGNRVTRSP